MSEATRIVATDCGSTTTKAILIERRDGQYRLPGPGGGAPPGGGAVDDGVGGGGAGAAGGRWGGGVVLNAPLRGEEGGRGPRGGGADPVVPAGHDPHVRGHRG